MVEKAPNLQNMKNKRIKFTLIFANILVIISLIYFLFKGFYHSGQTIAISGNGEYYFEINPVFQFLVVISIILPTLIAFLLKKYTWFSQAIIIILISFFWKEDFLQKTLFVNQPTSKAKVHKTVKQFVDNNENHINSIIDQLTENCIKLIKDYDGITTIQNIKRHDPHFVHSEMDTVYKENGKNLRYIKTASLSSELTQIKEYEIKGIILEKGKIIRLDFLLTQPNAKKHYWNFIRYYPQGIDNSSQIPTNSELYDLNTNYYLEQERIYIYKEHWTINLEGPFVKG